MVMNWSDSLEGPVQLGKRQREADCQAASLLKLKLQYAMYLNNMSSTEDEQSAWLKKCKLPEM